MGFSPVNPYMGYNPYMGVNQGMMSYYDPVQMQMMQMMQLMQLVQMMQMMMLMRMALQQFMGSSASGQQNPFGQGYSYGQSNTYGYRPNPWQRYSPYGETNTGPLPYNAVTGNQLADMSTAWSGRDFKPGQTKRCADFVSTMIEQSGAAPRGFHHEMSCSELQEYGAHVGRDQLKPGDIVYFGNTYTQGQFTHVGVYIGNGKFVHRPTANKPVKVDSLNSSYYASHFSGARRLNA